MRRVATALVIALLAALAAVAPPAGADGTTPVPATCTGIPIVGSIASTVNVIAEDDVDPVAPGGKVVNTIEVPIPATGSIPIEATINEVKLNIPVPAGVAVNKVTFSPSSFSTQSWQLFWGPIIIVTLSGSVTVGGGNPNPTVPTVTVETTVSGSPRTVEWKVPSSITAKASYALGSFTASCLPDDPNQVLLSTTVANPNTAPTATDQNVSTSRNTAKAVTLAGTDPESNPLSFLVATPPAHGALSGTAPNLTYTPTAGYVGSDSFTFTASDGSLSDVGTVSITVDPVVPAAPTAVSAVPGDGEATVRWTAPADDGGSALTGYEIVPLIGGVAQSPVPVGATSTEATVTGLADGTAHTFAVRAKNAKGTGPASAPSAAVTPGNCAPYSSCTVAVNDVYADLLGRAPSTSERTAAVNALTAGTTALDAFIASFRTGTDHLSNVDPVTRLYRAYFLRIPDKSGLTYWIGKRRAGTSKDTISQSFAGSNEFKTRYGTLTNLGFVNLVYQNVLGRPGEAAGVAYWVGQLDSGKKNRGQVMAGFSESQEYKNKQSAEVTTSVYWILLLGRAPTAPEFAASVAALEGGTTNAQLARTIVRTAEFDALAG